MRIWTHRNPLANPANTCARLWRCMYSRTEPTTPDMIMAKQRIHSELNASMCMKCRKYSNATMPPIPAACASGAIVSEGIAVGIGLASRVVATAGRTRPIMVRTDKRIFRIKIGH